MADMSREGILLLAKAYDFFAEKCQRHVDTALAEGKDASPFEAPVVEHKVVARALRLLAGEMGEPVAWRMTCIDPKLAKQPSPWVLLSSEPGPYNKSQYVVEPLYASLAPKEG